MDDIIFSDDDFCELIDSYCTLLEKGLNERWEKMRKDLYNNDIQEVIAALIARQVSLASHFAKGINIWNRHIGPIVLRTMIDAYITFAWILERPESRSKLFIEYGLGQEKIQIEHLKTTNGSDPEIEKQIKTREEWVNSQRYMDLTVVNVGSWSDSDTRKMAKEIGEENLYKFSYSLFSACCHNSWHHISIFNLKQCTNPLHKYHKVPSNPKFEPEIPYLLKSAEYTQMTFAKFDKKMNIECSTTLPLVYLIEYFENKQY